MSSSSTVPTCSGTPSDFAVSPLESAKTQLAGCDPETIHNVIQLCLEHMKMGIINFLWKTEDVSSWGNEEQALASRVEQISAPLASFLDERIRRVFANPSLLGKGGLVACNKVESCDNFPLPTIHHLFVDLEKMDGNNKLAFLFENVCDIGNKRYGSWINFDLDNLQTESEKIINDRKNTEMSWREMHKMSFVMQRVLPGEITPDLRSVSVSVNGERKRINFYFYYDKDISNQQNSKAHRIKEQCMASFPDFSSCVRVTLLHSSAPLPFFLEGQREFYKRDKPLV